MRGASAAIAGLGAAGMVLAACSVGPPPKTYVLDPFPAMTEPVEPLLGRPVLEMRRVVVPDYLDVSALQVRDQANLVRASETGRWGERLSVGIAHAVAGGLSRRLSGVVVMTSAPPGPARCELLLDVEAFEADVTGRTAFVGQWRVLAEGSPDPVAGERVSLTEPVAGLGDEPVVAAMSRIMDNLAARIARAIQGLGRTCLEAGRERQS
ncbi:MAG TPA: PqiC family protein [Alphaproteobacteria bacterium]|nr:PqiC family protein [Alphaproteobacteria bacterium]